MPRHFVTQWVMLADTEAKLQSKTVNEALCEMKFEALVDTLVSRLAKEMAKTLLDTLADPLAKLQANTIGKTLGDVEGKALLDTVNDTVVEVKTYSVWKKWVMYRPRDKSTGGLTHYQWWRTRLMATD